MEYPFIAPFQPKKIWLKFCKQFCKKFSDCEVEYGNVVEDSTSSKFKLLRSDELEACKSGCNCEKEQQELEESRDPECTDMCLDPTSAGATGFCHCSAVSALQPYSGEGGLLGYYYWGKRGNLHKNGYGILKPGYLVKLHQSYNYNSLYSVFRTYKYK